MVRSACAGGSNKGFTLLEVMIASALLATAGLSVVTIYLHSTRQAASARDLAIASSVARNSVEEGLARLVASESIGEARPITGWPALTIMYDEKTLDQEEAGTDVLKAQVAEDGGPEVLTLSIKRAVYVLPKDDEGVGSTDSAIRGGTSDGVQ